MPEHEFGFVKNTIIILIAVGVGIEIGGRMPGSSGIVGGIQAMRSAALANTPSRASIATAAAEGEEEEKPAAIAWKAAEEKPAAIAYDDGTAPAPIDVIGEKILRAIWMNRTRGKNRRYTSVTPSMLRRSRPVVGNVERLRLLGAKLRAGRCVHMLVIGASVSMGRNVGGVNAAWHARYIDYLRNILSGSLSMQVLSGRRKAQNGLFAPACLQHCMAWNSGPTVGGRNHAKAFGDWYFGRGGPAMSLDNDTNAAKLVTCKGNGVD